MLVMLWQHHQSGARPPPWARHTTSVESLQGYFYPLGQARWVIPGS